VGRVAPLEANEAPQVIALAVPSSLILTTRGWPVVAVPLRPEVIEVIAVARAVMVNISVVSTLMDGVAELATVFTRFVTLLFVKVSVVALPTKVSVPVGIVIVPLFEIEEMIGVVSVFPERVCVSVVPTMAPDGKVALILDVAIAADPEILALVMPPL